MTMHLDIKQGAANAATLLPWIDKDIHPVVKLLSGAGAIIAFLVALFTGLSLIASVGQPSTVALLYLAICVISTVVFVVCYRYSKYPANFTPRTGIVAP